MKKIILILFISYSKIIYAQSDCTQDSVLYMIAYNYIVNDSINKGKTITVSDSIVDLDRYWCSAELDSFPEEKKALKQYRENKKYVWFTTYYSQCLNTLFHHTKNISAKKVIFFSQIEDNMLLAELLPYKKQCNLFSYDEMAFLSTGQSYLFIFSKEGILKAAFSHEMIYD